MFIFKVQDVGTVIMLSFVQPCFHIIVFCRCYRFSEERYSRPLFLSSFLLSIRTERPKFSATEVVSAIKQAIFVKAKSLDIYTGYVD